MTKAEVTINGRAVSDVTVPVYQPTTPETALPPDIGLVEIGTTMMRGSLWFTGSGAPTDPGGQTGDMYLDMDTGDVYQWDGSGWAFQGTFAPSTDTPEEVLAKLVTVDGAGSGLDADLLDGHDSPYFATDADLDAETTSRVNGDSNLQSAINTEITNRTNADISLQAEIDAAEGVNTSQDSRMTAIEAKNTAQDNNLATINADQTTQNNRMTAIETVNTGQDSRMTTIEAKNTSQDTAINGKEPTIVAGNPAYFWAGDKTWKPVPPAGIPEAPTDGITYGRKNAAWSAVVGGAIVADTPPAPPLQNGQLWFESDTGALYMWYADGTSDQWVMVAGPGAAQQNDFVRKAGDTMTGGLTVTAGNILSGSGHFVGGIATFLSTGLGTGIAGNIYLRPKGANDAASQAYVDTNGAFVTSGVINCNAGNITALSGYLQSRTSGAAGVSVYNLTTGQAFGWYSAGDSTFKAYQSLASGAPTGSPVFSIDTTGNAIVPNTLTSGGRVLAGNGCMDPTSLYGWYFSSPNAVYAFTTAYRLTGSTGSGDVTLVRANATWTLWRASDAALWHQFSVTYKPGGGPWIDSSDSRIKTVHGDYTNGLEAIKSLRPVHYSYIGNDTDEPPVAARPGQGEYRRADAEEPFWDEEAEREKLSKITPTVPYGNSNHYNAAKSGQEFIGLIAQEAEVLMPEIITKKTAYIDGVEVDDLRDIDTGPLIFTLINAVKELAAKVEALEAARGV